MNILLDGFVCPSCFNTFDINKGEIKGDAFTYDEAHNELYCNCCGLVVKDSSLTPIKVLEYFKTRDKLYKSNKTSENSPKDEVMDSYEFILLVKQRRKQLEKIAEEKLAEYKTKKKKKRRKKK